MYRCIHCLTPCGALYRKYGAATIKLSQCSECKRDVDPYCEREWLLVVLDCILLREQAYRHLLFHRRIELHGHLKSIFVLCAVLRARFMWSLNQDLEFDSIWFCQQVVRSMMLLLLTTGAVFMLFSMNDAMNTTTSKADLVTLVYLALALPAVMCHAVTLGVQIWEASDTVRQLGSLLVLVYQWMGLATIGNHRLLATGGLLLTLVARALVNHATHCPGLELLIQHNMVSLCFA